MSAVQAPRSESVEEAQRPEEVIFLIEGDPRLEPEAKGLKPDQRAPDCSEQVRAEPVLRKGCATGRPAGRLTLDPGLFEPPPQAQTRKSLLSALKPSVSHDEKGRVQFLQGQDVGR